MESGVTRLIGARVAVSATRAERIDLTIRRSWILPFDTRPDKARVKDLSGYLLLPGLINAHDHLEFNLFPRLGRPPYANASAWAADIYHPDQSPVREHLRVAKRDRLLWGGIKNLLSGATTVAHHNPYEAAVFRRDFPVRVVRRFGWAHSLAFSPDLAEAWQATPARWPFIVHAGEGTDECAHREISRLKEMGVLSARTVLVHAVATTTHDLEAICQSGTSIVWCPSSNLFSLGRTLSAEALQSGAKIALGTDSALTGEGDLIDEMKHAGEKAYPLVTTGAARVLRLNAGQGSIRERGVADLVAVADRGQTPGEAMVDLRPELVILGGKTMLVPDRGGVPPGFHAIEVEGRGRCRIRAEIPDLYARTAQALGPGFRLAGRRVRL